MKNEHKQLEIIQSQIANAMDIVLNQIKRYESLQSELLKHPWTCEDDGRDNDLAAALLEAVGALEQAYENINL